MSDGDGKNCFFKFFLAPHGIAIFLLGLPCVYIPAYAKGNVYCATKAAVKAITDGLRIGVAKSAERVTNLKPGLVEASGSFIHRE